MKLSADQFHKIKTDMPNVRVSSESECRLGYLIPGVLVLVALCQIWLTSTQGLTQWKGGGFGMFSTVDSLSDRFLKAYLASEDGSVRLPIAVPMSAGIRDAEERVRAMPSERRVTRLASLIENSYWDVEDLVIADAADGVEEKPAVSTVADRHPPRSRELTQLVIEVWGLSFDRRARVVEAREIRSYTFDRRAIADSEVL